ncbi:MAG: hypothetical protein IKU72_02860 [Oscillospiraceae bacterium]|nr:hypothetical protein [Oscillospiraceae bacterium]
MDLWMAALLLGLVFAGVFTLAEIVVGTVLLHRRLDGMILLIPLVGKMGEKRLREAVDWLEWQRGVFPGHVAAADLGLDDREKERCKVFCKGSGVIWIEREEAAQLESFVEKIGRMDYT